MEFNTPWGTADDQSASYFCGLQEGLAIGAITGGVNSNSKGEESTAINGSFVGWDEPISTINKTYCSEYIEQNSDGEYNVSFGYVQDLLYNTFSLAKMRYKFERFIESPDDYQYDVGVKIWFSENAEIRIYMTGLKSDIDEKGIYGVGYSTSGGDRILYNIRIKNEIVGYTFQFMQLSSGITEYDTKARFEFTIQYYDFEDNGFVWVKPGAGMSLITLILPYNDNVFYINGYVFYDNDSTQMYNDVIISTTSVSQGLHPSLVTYYDSVTDNAKSNCSKIFKPTIKGRNDYNIVELDNVGVFQLNNTTEKGIKLTLIDDDEKYLYFRRYGANALLINRGTF